MNDELQASIKQGLDLLWTGIKTVGVEANKQIPQVLQEKLTYDFYYYLFFIIFWVVIAGMGILLSKWSFKKAEAVRYDGDGWRCLGIGSFLPCLIALGTLINNIPILIKIHVAPRLYIMEWITSLLHKS